VIKEGWLHKRATNGIWQKRYFVLTPASFSYTLRPSAPPKNSPRWNIVNTPPPKAMEMRSTSIEDGGASERQETASVKGAGESSKSVIPVEELRDVHSTGTGGDFSLCHNERQMRLRADTAPEAARWVEALVTQQLEGRRNEDGEQDAKGVLEGLVSPVLSVLAMGKSGELVQHTALGKCVLTVVDQLREGREVKEKLAHICEMADSIPAGEAPDLPLPRTLREWGLPESQTARLLRWAHPRVLQPLTATLFDNLSTKLIIDVDKRSWETRLEFEPAPADGYEVTVRHWLWWHATVRRTTVANAPTLSSKSVDDEVTRFRFKLQLKLNFLPNSVEEILRCELHVIDYEFEPCSRQAKDEGKAALKPLCLPHLEYYQIWSRPLHRLPVHKDVPRLLKGMLVTTYDGRELYRDDGTAKPSDPAKQVNALRSLMLALATELDPPAVPTIIEEKLPEYLHAQTGDVAEGLRSFLLESGMPEHAICVQILKCIHQELIFPAVSSLRNSIYTVLPYKDIKGEWRVAVDIGVDSVKVTHRKWEQTQDYDAAAFFKFRWGLTLIFDRRMRTLLETSVFVLDFEFGPSTSEECKRVASAVLKPWLGPGVLYKRMWATAF